MTFPAMIKDFADSYYLVCQGLLSRKTQTNAEMFLMFVF